MNALVSIQATLNNSSNNFVISWQLSSGGAIIGSIAPVKPYGNPFQVTIPGLTPNVSYIITLWESTTTSPTGTVRNATNVIPSLTTTTIRANDYLEVDATPGLTSGTSSYVNTSYAGWGYEVEEVGVKVLFPQGAPNIADPDYDQDTGGGWHLVRSGDTFQTGQQYVVRFLPQVAPASASTQGAYTTGVVITAAITLDSTYLNQALKIKGSGASVPIILPALSTVGDYQFVYLFSAGGNHISAPITCAGADKIQRNSLVGQLVLNQNEVLKLYKADALWNIDTLEWWGDSVGEYVYKYTNTEFPYVPANGLLLSRTTYARLFAWLNNGGMSGSIVSEATWANTTTVDGTTYFTNKGKWTLGDGSTNFRVPYLMNYYMRPIDPANGRTAGDAAVETIRAHDHTLHGAGAIIMGGVNWFLSRLFGGRYSGGGGDPFGGKNGSPDNTMRTGKDCGASLSLPTETSPTNTSTYVLIRI